MSPDEAGAKLGAVKFKELDIVKVTRLGRGADANVEDGADRNWVVGREAIFDSYFPNDGPVLVWIEGPDEWQLWTLEEDDLQATGKTAPRLPDESED